MARVCILKETTNGIPGDWALWFQWARYDMDDEGILFGYRFIWRRPDGALQGARGQARLPSIAEAAALMERAQAEGWGDRSWELMEAAARRLEAHGCVVQLDTGYVGWPDKEAAAKGRLTPEMIADAKLLQRWC